jgi:glutamate--cysteine ligase
VTDVDEHDRITDVADAEAYVAGVCFKIGPPRLLGVELEWFVHDAEDPTSPLPADRLAAALGPHCPAGLVPTLAPTPDHPPPPATGPAPTGSGPTTAQAPSPLTALPPAPPIPGRPGTPGLTIRPGSAPAAAPRGVTDAGTASAGGRAGTSHHLPVPLPRGAAVTVEPGGQVEISSRPAPSLDACLTDTAADLQSLVARFADAGLRLTGAGIDPHRPPRRILTLPRYAAMEAYFDRTGPHGRTMMCSTASVQVCVDAGGTGTGTGSVAHRWQLAHALGPVLLAAFAHSPVHQGRLTGWRSTRQAAWYGIDPARTRRPETAPDPSAGYARWALDAPLLCRRQAGESWEVPSGLTFAEWVRVAAGTADAPTYGDLRYHLTTLFPPVRPQGHLELRYLDAQDGDGWTVVTAVVAALFADERAADDAAAAAEPVAERWVDAARCGLTDPELARAARRCLDAARAALERAGVAEDTRRAVDAFAARYTERARCPADDVLEGITRPRTPADRPPPDAGTDRLPDRPKETV